MYLITSTNNFKTKLKMNNLLKIRIFFFNFELHKYRKNKLNKYNNEMFEY